MSGTPQEAIHATNSDGSYKGSELPGGTLVIPDGIITDGAGNPHNVPAGENFTVPPCGAISTLDPQKLNDQLTQAQKNSINTVYLLPTGQTTSYATGDDGGLKHGRLTDFYTLKYFNSYGNKNRFTDEIGLQVYPSNYVIDNATGLGWYRIEQAGESWAAAVASANSFSLVTEIGTLNGFFLPNVTEFLSIANMENLNNTILNYAPFNIAGSSTGRWTSTSISSPPTSAIKISTAVLPQLTASAKTGTGPFFIARYQNISV